MYSSPVYKCTVVHKQGAEQTGEFNNRDVKMKTLLCLKTKFSQA